jgi:hypothetical protein
MTYHPDLEYDLTGAALTIVERDHDRMPEIAEAEAAEALRRISEGVADGTLTAADCKAEADAVLHTGPRPKVDDPNDWPMP